MPLMQNWVEINVEEDLLIPVVRELLDLAADPNHVEVVYGAAGRVILAEVQLAEHWYQERLKRSKTEEVETEVHAGSYEVVAPEKVDKEDTAHATVVQAGTNDLIPLPAKRGPGRSRSAPEPSASLDGEEPK